jgi:polysaccharide deacetylase family protein (PEP-CTERM system associated)
MTVYKKSTFEWPENLLKAKDVKLDIADFAGPTPPVVGTVDVEDWIQSTWDHSHPITERSLYSTEKLLEILAKHGKTVTMFVLGKFAERFPVIIKKMAQDGHEIASHGYGHIEVFHMSPADFQKDVARSKSFLEDLIGKPVIGYRAPDFSIIPKTTWALDILVEQGFKYDSSIFPIKNNRYGISNWPVYPAHIQLPSGNRIVELPVSTISGLKRNWPVAGGGYHRILPKHIIRWAIRQVQNTGRPFITYCHPYEFDTSEFAALKSRIPFKTRLHQGLGRRKFQSKFEDILATFEMVLARHIAFGWDLPTYIL